VQTTTLNDLLFTEARQAACGETTRIILLNKMEEIEGKERK
jgi:hypothetical protein